MRLRLVVAGVCSRRPWPRRRPRSPRRPNPQEAGLQVALRAQGLYLGPIDAISGPETVAAVRAFQRSTGCGSRASRTRARAPRWARSAARSSARGRCTAERSAGTSPCSSSCSSSTGSASPSTPTSTGRRCAACALLQRRLHLRTDGVVGPQTFAALESATRCRSRGRVAVAAHHGPHHHRQRTLTGVHVVRRATRCRTRAALPHDGREARAAEPARPEPLPPDRHAAPRRRASPRRRAPASPAHRASSPSARCSTTGPGTTGSASTSSARSRGWSPATTTRSSRRSGRRGSCSSCPRPSATPRTS